MPDEMIVRNCAPTLASLKAGSLFSCAYESAEEMRQAVRTVNDRLCKTGLRVIPLRYENKHALIYLYRPGMLSKTLSSAEACRLLRESGYPCEGADRCVIHLISRLQNAKDFPHEIGLFLGYPPADVDGFMHRKSECKYAGLWKVYGDVDQAKHLFSMYRKCTENYLDRLSKGKTLESMAVAT